MPLTGSEADEPVGTSGLSWSLPAVLLVVSVAGIAGFGLPASAPDEPVAALFPPWWDQARSLGAAATAGGAVLGLGRLPGLVLTRSSVPGFSGRLRAAGALVLFDPRGLRFCTPAKERQS